MTFLYVLVAISITLQIVEWSDRKKASTPRTPVSETRRFDDFRSVVSQRLDELEKRVTHIEDANDPSLSEPFAGQFSNR